MRMSYNIAADDQVTFRYTVSESGRTAYCTLPAQEFLHRFLQHILPKGLVKVRYYGMVRVGNRGSLARLRSQLRLLLHLAEQAMLAPVAIDRGTAPAVICSNCGQPMHVQRVLLPHNRGPPSDADTVLNQHLCMHQVAWSPCACTLRCARERFRAPHIEALPSAPVAIRC